MKRRRSHLGFDLVEMESYKYLGSAGRIVAGPVVKTRLFIVSFLERHARP